MSELLEQKNFFMIIQRRQNLQKLADVAFNTANTRESRETTLALLCKFVQQFRDRVKSNTVNDDSGDMGINGDDDIVVEENNEDENDEAKKKANDLVYTQLASFVGPLAKIISQVNEPVYATSTFCDTRVK